MQRCTIFHLSKSAALTNPSRDQFVKSGLVNLLLNHLRQHALTQIWTRNFTNTILQCVITPSKRGATIKSPNDVHINKLHHLVADIRIRLKLLIFNNLIIKVNCIIIWLNNLFIMQYISQYNLLIYVHTYSYGMENLCHVLSILPLMWTMFTYFYFSY